MITIQIEKEKNNFKKFTIFGHANYDEYGKDIVCAATSAIITTTINGILGICDSALKYKDDGNILEIYAIKQDKITDQLLKNMVLLLKELEKQYKKNIKIIMKGE